MGRALTLEDFDRRAPARTAAPGAAGAALSADPPADSHTVAELEQARLQAFEKGYGAGWEDSARAHREEQDTISAEFGRALQDMSFTFHEAQTALMQEIEGLLAGLIETVLPEALVPALAAMVRERALDMARQSGSVVEIVVAPANVARVEALVQGRPAPPLRVVGEPALGDGQAFLRFGGTEEKLDLDGALADLRAAVARFAAEGASAEPGASGARERAANGGDTGAAAAGEVEAGSDAGEAMEMRYA